MRRIVRAWWVVAFLAIVAAGAGAQQAASEPASGTAPTPKPDKDGVYRVEPGIVPPWIVKPAQANPPAGGQADRPRMVRLTAVIGADGTVKDIAVLDPIDDALDAAATMAVKASKFEAGTLNASPVPVRVCVRVPFFGVSLPVPRLWPCPTAGDLMAHAGVRPPRLVYAPIPEYSDEARRKNIQGIVVLSALVDEQGRPTDIRVERSLGYGLDEEAVEAVSQYQFKPATTLDGKPVAERIRIQVSFRRH
jgi:TonB family protein